MAFFSESRHLPAPDTYLPSIHTTQLLHEVAAQILFSAVKRMRCNHYFLSLDPRDQVALLETTWSELFLFSTAYWPVDIGIIILRMYTNQASESVFVCKDTDTYNT